MNEVTVNMENLNDDEKKQLLALVEKANKPFEVWKPTENDKGFVLSGKGIVFPSHYLDDSNGYYKQGRCAETEEELIFQREQERILTQYKRLAAESWAGEKIDWNDVDIPKCYIEFGRNIGWNQEQTTKVQGVVYFKTEKSLKAAIKTIGEENIIKYLF